MFSKEAGLAGTTRDTVLFGVRLLAGAFLRALRVDEWINFAKRSCRKQGQALFLSKRSRYFGLGTKEIAIR